MNQWIFGIHFLKGCYIYFIQIMDVICIVHPLTFVSAKIIKKGILFLLISNLFNIFSLYNYGSRLFLTNINI
jgi:hypothetical protein